MMNKAGWYLWLVLLTLLSFSATSPAHDKVVVVPLDEDVAAKNKVIFITNDTYQGNLFGLSGADDICQESADSADSKVKGKQFKAWLGPATDPLEGERLFLVHELPYLTPNGTVLANSYSHLITMDPWPFLRISAAGVDVTSLSSYDDVWTGRSFSGVPTNLNCVDWTSTTSSVGSPPFYEQTPGTSSYTTPFGSIISCDATTARLICMEQ